MDSLFSLAGKTAVITGCATGIGQGLAVGLAKAGADIIALDIADLEDTRQKVTGLGRVCGCYHVDLADSHSIDTAWNALLSDFKTVDILFNNAGMQYRASAFEYPEAMFDKIVAVNLKAAYLLSQKAARHFQSRGCPGKIINTASLFTTFGGVEVSGYTCTKHGIMGMTKALSNELAPYGICVNAIAPGYIQTELTRAIWSDPERRGPMDARIPLGRWGTPADFEGIAVFLASSASDYITGVMIPVDGGYTVR
ncbi:SDR family oxidoreductase [Oscillibacter sp.]|uniref:SDR family oxidoreductase n=1 Tax=Oscillibacter sp. TaxID=1945593 RepID=UPI0026216434|nr:SDR family oxidoreductase [Oscillibacter sp.]MDD3347105.1 SDR family oxidoreductase [Oscillibacter sp.]